MIFWSCGKRVLIEAGDDDDFCVRYASELMALSR